ncbi:MAG: serine protease [bacterium]
MKILNITKFSFLLVFILIVSSCSTFIRDSVYPTLSDFKYDSEFPYKNCSSQLEEISNSVRLVNVIAYYRNYLVNPAEKLIKSQITPDNFDEKTFYKGTFHKTASGTATIVYAFNGYVALLTCAHIISFPDTLYAFRIDTNGTVTRHVESISIKTKQTNYVTDFPEGGDVDILVKDNYNDLAIIGRRFYQYNLNSFPLFKYPLGKARELEWGSFVYALGYPMNYKMVTKGIVSSPNRDDNGSFLIDAVFNRGFSGGIVLAIRDGVPNFELVGLVRSVPAEYEYTLKPEIPTDDYEFNPLVPYKGQLFIDQKVNIKYGVTRVIPIETVISFIQRNYDVLINNGYALDNFK